MESVLCVSGAEVAQRLCDWNADPKVAPCMDDFLLAECWGLMTELLRDSVGECKPGDWLSM